MARVQRSGSSVSTDIGSAPGAGVSRIFDFSSPAAWTLLFWWLSVAVIVLIFFSL